MKTRLALVVFVALGLVLQGVFAGTLTPDNIGAPFGVQPLVGLTVNGGMSDSFFSDLSGLPFPGPGITTILGNVQAFDSGGNPISMFSIAAVTVTQGGSFSPMLDMFMVTSPVTYTSTLNPLNQVTINPGDLNLAFLFNSDPSFQYSYALMTSGIPDGGFVLFNDVEGTFIPEPALGFPIALVLIGMLVGRTLDARRRQVATQEGRTSTS